MLNHYVKYYNTDPRAATRCDAREALDMAVRQVDRARGSADTPERRSTPALWHLKVSHYNEKVRWALDYKRVPHVRRAETPGRHQAIAQRLIGDRTFPVLVIDGEALGDSSTIIGAL